MATEQIKLHTLYRVFPESLYVLNIDLNILYALPHIILLLTS